MSISFRDFVEQLQENSKAQELRRAIKSHEDHMNQRSNSSERYAISGEMDKDHSHLRHLNRELSKVDPNHKKVSHERQKELNQAKKRLDDHNKKQRQASEKITKAADKRKIDIPSKNRAEAAVRKHMPAEKIQPGEDMMKYLERTKDHHNVRKRIERKLYNNIKKRREKNEE